MPKVTFIPSGLSGEVPEKTTIFESAEQLGLDIPHECGCFATCSTCRVVVEKGSENLSEIEFDEENMLEVAELLPPYRLSCQAKILGDVTIQIEGSGDKTGE